MDIFLYSIIFIIGTLFGSFFTLAVYRIPLKKDIIHEHSFCPNCNHKLSFLDLIPILSYVFLGGKCRYCKQKIRPRYLFLEIFSGLAFVLFAISMKLSIYSFSLNLIMYLIFGLLYFAVLFIIAGIEKEKGYVEKSVLLFGYILETLYIIYLYIVAKEPNIYRYVIYLSVIVVLILIDTVFLRKKTKNSYPVEILLLCMLLVTFSGEAVTFLSITFTLLIIAIELVIRKITSLKSKKSEKNEIKNSEIKPVPIGYYLCITNIICLIIANYYIFH